MLEHVALSIGIELLALLLTRSWAAGAAAATAWSICREITQAEYRWIEQFGGGLRSNMPWWGGLDLRVWKYGDPWLDWIVPSAAAMALALVAAWTRRRRLASAN